MNIRCWIFGHKWQKENWENANSAEIEMKVCERCRKWQNK